jgi:uncharacterized SAM-binding protein YcdF (DUF218 family)
MPRTAGKTHSPARPATRPRLAQRRKQPRGRFPFVRAFLVLAACVFALLLWAIIARHTAPMGDVGHQTFDAIIILGTPADSDGNPTPELLDRVTEGVHEYERGVARQIIVTGAAAHNGFVEADVMARVAQAQGVPASQIVEEPKALDTIQNACYSARIMKNHGWHSAEVVSSASHLPRAAMIFSHLPVERIEWRMHMAPANLTPGYYSSAADLVETLKTARYLVWSRWIETCDL